MPVHASWVSYDEMEAEFERRIESKVAARSFLHHAIHTNLIRVRFRKIDGKTNRQVTSKSKGSCPEFMKLSPHQADNIDFDHKRTNLTWGQLALVERWDEKSAVIEGAQFSWRDMAKIFGRKGAGGRAIKADSWARLTQVLFQMALDGQFNNFTSLSEFKREVREVLEDPEAALHATSYDKDLEQIWKKHSPKTVDEDCGES